jgi:hypothetical protein
VGKPLDVGSCRRLLRRHVEHADVIFGISGALRVGSTSADVVALKARKAATHHGSGITAVKGSLRRDRVVSRTERRLAVLPAGNQPLRSVHQYDELLRRECS